MSAMTEQHMLAPYPQMSPLLNRTAVTPDRSTKIIATLGPATLDAEVVLGMVKAGMDVARVNFSHTNDPREVLELVEMVRTASALAGRQVAILGDLCGPKMRLRHVPDGAYGVEPGDRFILYPIGVSPPGLDCPLPSCAVSIPTLCDDTRPGDRVLIADGRIAGVVDTISADGVTVTVSTGGLIEERKGVNLPDTRLQGLALTAKDRHDVVAGLAAGFDLFALSFVRDASDADQLRDVLPAGMPVIAKVERPEALEHFDTIRAAADGVMVARGDLGVEVGWERLPGLQMDLVSSALDHGKLSIVATEMLESMTHQDRPTRAEVSDVASAVMDGASAVMLSAETAMGHDPVKVVSTMGRILSDIEQHTRYRRRNQSQQLGPKYQSRSAAFASAATWLARDVKASAILTVAHSGTTSRLVSAARPSVPIVALCDDPQVSRYLALWWGVVPLLDESVESPSDGTIRSVLKATLGLSSGPVIVVASTPGGLASDQIRIVDL
jgi:pyruvate kinase